MIGPLAFVQQLSWITKYGSHAYIFFSYSLKVNRGN